MKGDIQQNAYERLLLQYFIQFYIFWNISLHYKISNVTILILFRPIFDIFKYNKVCIFRFHIHFTFRFKALNLLFNEWNYFHRHWKNSFVIVYSSSNIFYMFWFISYVRLTWVFLHKNFMKMYLAGRSATNFYKVRVTETKNIYLYILRCWGKNWACSCYKCPSKFAWFMTNVVW